MSSTAGSRHNVQACPPPPPGLPAVWHVVTTSLLLGAGHERGLRSGTTPAWVKKLEALAGKLEKLAAKYGDSYYGRAASESYQAYLDSDRKSLTDERER